MVEPQKLELQPALTCVLVAVLEITSGKRAVVELCLGEEVGSLALRRDLVVAPVSWARVCCTGWCPRRETMSQQRTAVKCPPLRRFALAEIEPAASAILAV